MNKKPTIKKPAPKKKWNGKGKHPGGRPTKFYPEICEELIDWFDQEPWDELNGKRIPRKLPTLIAFARAKKIGLSTIYDWIDSKHSSYQKEFSEIYTQRAKEAQREVLTQNALQGLYNPVFSKFLAINITDMRDKQDIEHSGRVDINVIYDEAKDAG